MGSSETLTVDETARGLSETLTVDETARVLGISRPAAYRGTHNGEGIGSTGGSAQAS